MTVDYTHSLIKLYHKEVLCDQTNTTDPIDILEFVEQGRNSKSNDTDGIYETGKKIGNNELREKMRNNESRELDATVSLGGRGEITKTYTIKAPEFCLFMTHIPEIEGIYSEMIESLCNPFANKVGRES